MTRTNAVRSLGSKRTTRHFLFLYIAFLCFAVFGSHTAHFAKTASQPFRQTPCRVKVAANTPVSKISSEVRARRIVRPAQPATFGAGIFGERQQLQAATSAGNLQALRVRDGIHIPAQARPFALRV